MLTELHIQNFAIIDRLDLFFESGLVTFTGETGAGKSIIIDAVENLLGGRAETTAVRAGADIAYLEAVFTIPPANRTAIETLLEAEQLLDDPNLITLSREIRTSGRNVARVNGRTVSVALMRELGEYLVDVHGQSEHLSLLRTREHLRLLDNYALALPNAPGDEPHSQLLQTYRQTYRHLEQVKRDLDALRQAEQDAARRTDVLTYQVGEIDAAHIKIDEEESLIEERNRLANAEGLASLTQEALLALDEGTPEAPAASDLLGQVVDALTRLARLDPARADLHETAQLLFENLTELNQALREYLENIEFNPRRLNQVEERLALFQSLKRKYGPTLADVAAYAEKARQELDTISHAEERIQELSAQQEQLLARLGAAGQALSRRRHAAAERLSAAIEGELADLHMSGARFQVAFEQRPDPAGAPLEDGDRVAYDVTGLERVEFLIAPNPGEGLKPLVKIASGGETSRLMLALKNVLAKADSIPTLIFDEIDQGIGGRVGSIVGAKLWNLARDHQVLCITHLPQLAAYGDHHYQVQKLVSSGRTTTQVLPLEGEERLHELALMMGEVSESTIDSARELIHMAGKRTTPS